MLPYLFDRLSTWGHCTDQNCTGASTQRALQKPRQGARPVGNIVFYPITHEPIWMRAIRVIGDSRGTALASFGAKI